MYSIICLELDVYWEAETVAGLGATGLGGYWGTTGSARFNSI